MAIAPDKRARRAIPLLAGIATDDIRSEHWEATAPDVRAAYVDWATKPRCARERRKRAQTILTELEFEPKLHFQPRTVSWWDVLGF